MTDENQEDIDSTTDDVEVETTEETTTEDSKEELTDREKQFLARAKKAEGKVKGLKESLEEPKPEIKKPNVEQNVATKEHSYLFAQGLEPEEVDLVERVALNEGTTLTEAYKSDYVQTKINEKREQAKIKANSLPASGGSPNAPRAKTTGNMTDDEHREYGEARLKDAINK